MNGMICIRKGVSGVLVLGMALWNAAIPAVWAQIEPRVIDQCRDVIVNDPTIDPAVRDVCLTDVLPKVEEAATEGDAASPEAKAELQVVETTAVAIAGANEATQEVLANPDAVVNSTVSALQSNGVPADVVARVQAQMQDALTRASATLSGGGTVADTAKYFETCQKAMAECSAYLGGKDLKEIFAAGGAGFDQREIAFCAVAFDPSQRDGFGAVMEAHFSASMREMMVQGGGMEAMRGMMEQMGATGINPAEMMAHAGGEFHGPSPEAIAAMSETDKAMFEAWQKGDFAAIEAAQIEAARMGAEAAGMDPARVAAEISHMREMMTMQDVEAMYREYAASEMTGGNMDPRTMDSRADSSTTSETTFATQGVTGSIAPTTSPGTTEALVPSQDGLFHYDTNSDGIADHSHTAPH